MKNIDAAKEWLNFATSAYDVAKIGKATKRVLYEDLCFQAQQAVEKALKAILIYHDKPFPKTHSIKMLLVLLRETGENIPSVINEAEKLTDYAVDSRYPDDFSNEDKIDNAEYKQALKLAEKALKFAKTIIEKKNEKLF